ncbi:hypothetical protein POTOM_013229 [Populus tomentosa]|uniref:Protein root UVB sensitive/RUS domain-containing protein n=1 Tax=Populus tomentosa TaxID=118781 RepID=A0A8X8A297_POPTO|nr:hypothetical protein POTOM_013229 [Populus tomentosa]
MESIAHVNGGNFLTGGQPTTCFLLQLGGAPTFICVVLAASFNPDWFPLNQTRNIRGSNWARLVPDFSKDEFVVSPTSPSSSLFFVKELWSQCTALFVRLMLPQGFPQSVTFDYLDYSLCEPSKALQAKLVVSLPPRYLSIILVIHLLLLLAATRSCFYAGFAAQRNFAEVIAKGEAQGMVSNFIGIMLGIALACTGSSTSLALASFSLVRTSSGARYAASDIEQRLHLGSKLSDVVNNKNDVLALFNLYRDEGYILTEHGDDYVNQGVLKEVLHNMTCSSHCSKLIIYTGWREMLELKHEASLLTADLGGGYESLWNMLNGNSTM